MTILFRENELIIGSTTIPENVTFRFSDILKLGGGGSQPTWQDIILSGNTALTLVNAKADGLNYLKLFGGTELLPETYIDSVTLDGKCEQRNLPSGYTQIESLANTSGAYIATSISLDDNDEIEFWWNAEMSGSVFAFSQGASTDNKAFQLANTSDNGVVFDIQNYNPYRVITNVQAYNNGVKHIVIKNREIFIDGVSYGTSQGSVANPTNTLRLFISSAGVTSLSKFSNRFTVKNKINLIFARRNSDSVLGMYDTVTNTFLTNAGTGNFIAGADVTPTPDNPMDIVSNNGTIKYSANIANVNAQTALVGYYITTGGVVTADIYNWIYQDFIPVKPNTTYTLTMSSSVYFVSISEYSTADDSGFVIRKAGSTGSNTKLTITTGATTNYVRFGTNINRTAVTLDTVLAIDWMLNVGDTMAYQPYVEGGLYTDGTTETVTDSNQLTATAQMLLGVGNTKDTQEVLTGVVTRNIGVLVLDGTETWGASSVYTGSCYTQLSQSTAGAYTPLFVTHFIGKTTEVGYSAGSALYNGRNLSLWLSNSTTPTTLKSWLAEQYNAGTPVIVVYPINSPTTETVSPQILQKEPVTVTGSLSDLVANVVSSSHTTPTPTQPLPINTNNGILTFGVENTYTIVDGQGTFVSPASSTTNRIYKAFGKLKAGKYKVKITGDFEFIFQYKDTLDLTPTQSGNVGTWATEGEYEITDTSMYYGVAIRNAGGSGSIYPSYFNNIGSIGYTYLGVTPVGTVETVEVTGKNLYNSATKTTGYYISATGVITAEPNSAYSALIPVLPNTTYILGGYTFSNSSNKRLHAYDKEGNWISQINYVTVSGQGEYSVYGITPANCRYIRISIINSDSNVQLELGSTATDYEPYYNGGSATAEMLLKLDNYQDVQSVLDGQVTRKVGIKVLNGTENWAAATRGYYVSIPDKWQDRGAVLRCTHFKYSTSTLQNIPDNSIMSFGTSNIGISMDTMTSLDDFKAFLADQYNSGNPVIVVYPLATSTTETVTAQPLTIQAGTNVVEITQASIDNLGLEVSYKGTV